MKKLKTKRAASVDAPVKLIWKSSAIFQTSLELDEAVNRLLGIPHLNGKIALDTRLDNLKQLNSVILLFHTSPYPIGRWLITTLRETSSGTLEVESTGGFDVLSWFPSLLIIFFIVSVVAIAWPSSMSIIIAVSSITLSILSILIMRYWVKQDIKHLQNQIQKSLFSKDDWIKIVHGGFKQI